MMRGSLLEAAIEASGLSARRFAVDVLAVDERTVRRWRAGDRAMPGPALQLCRLIIAKPKLVPLLATPPAKQTDTPRAEHGKVYRGHVHTPTHKPTRAAVNE